jgi:hypothetical protein
MRSSSVRQISMCLAVSGGLALTIVTATKPAAATTADPITGYVYDNILYQQTSNSAPTSPQGYFFDMGVYFNTAGDYTKGTTFYPGHPPQTLPAPAGSTQFDYESSLYSTMSALHAAYPFGHYAITASGGSSGTATASINYTHDYFTHAIPYLTNYSSLNGLNAAANFLVDYDSFTPNSRVSQGFTFFTITDASTGATVFSDPFQASSSMSALISAGTLSPDTTYDYELDFSDRLNGYDWKNGSFTVQGFDVRTDGSFTTGGAETPLPAALPLFASGIGAMGLFGWRRKRKAAAIAAA